VRLQRSGRTVWHAGQMGDGLVSTGTAAKELGVAPTTLQRWAHAGLVEPALVTAGGHFRWNLDILRGQLPRVTGRQPEPQPVVAAIITSPLGVLVGRRNDGSPPWTFIAGEVEPGESPEDAAVREVKEETGCLAEVDEVIGERDHPATGRHMIYMAGHPTHGTEVHVGDRDELAEVRWVTLAEADELLPGMFGPVRDYLARVL
jgi:8-oxo-dGTP pyrophosphatase MutT (NUDIX family)